MISPPSCPMAAASAGVSGGTSGRPRDSCGMSSAEAFTFVLLFSVAGDGLTTALVGGTGDAGVFWTGGVLNGIAP